jgi:hypothetical protein
MPHSGALTPQKSSSIAIHRLIHQYYKETGMLRDFLDRLAEIKGILPLSGLVLVIISLIAQFVPALEFLAVGNWLLHVGVIIGLLGLMIADAL